VQDVLLAGQRSLVDTDLARYHGEKSLSRIAGEKDVLAPGIGPQFGDTGQGGQFPGAEPGKKTDAGKSLGFLHAVHSF
jgi:hypothetical protein